jgi:hypothetical protein
MVKPVACPGSVSLHIFVFAGHAQIDGDARKIEGRAVGCSELLPPDQPGLQGFGKEGDHFFQIPADDMDVVKSIGHGGTLPVGKVEIS